MGHSVQGQASGHSRRGVGNELQAQPRLGSCRAVTGEANPLPGTRHRAWREVCLNIREVNCLETNSLVKWFSLGLFQQIACPTVLPKKSETFPRWPGSSPWSLLQAGS